jgi:hypothetical protein
MMGNFEAVARYKIGVTALHINNGGYSGYGPGFWGGGHDPYTWKVSDHASACMANMAKSVGFYSEDVTKPSRCYRRSSARSMRTPRDGRRSSSSSARTHPVHGGGCGPRRAADTRSRSRARQAAPRERRRAAA